MATYKNSVRKSAKKSPKSGPRKAEPRESVTVAVAVAVELSPVEQDAMVQARLNQVRDLVSARQRVLFTSRRDEALRALLAETEGQRQAEGIRADGATARREALAALVQTILSELNPEVG